MNIFDLEHIGFAYQQNKQNVFIDLNIEIGIGERIALIGSNGSGKTTLLRLLNGLYFPSQGKIRYRGTELSRKTLSDPAFRRRFRLDVALLFQNAGAMLFHESAGADIRFSLQQANHNDDGTLRDHRPPFQNAGEVLERALTEIAESMDVLHLLDRPPYLLSEGEKKRVAFACILALQPTVLLLDEPFAGLDPETEERLVQILHRFRGTVLLSTHRLSLIPRIADRTIHLP